MSCAIKFMKFVLFSLNLLFVLIGLALVVTGSWAVFNIPSFMQTATFAFETDPLASEVYQNARLTQTIAYVCLGLGLFMFVVAFLGCCGVVTDNHCLLITYAVIVSHLFVAQIICILVFLLLGEQLSPAIISRFQNSFSANYQGYLGLQQTTRSSAYSQTMDAIMLKFGCCGVYGAGDFGNGSAPTRWHSEGRRYVDASGEEVTGDRVGIPVACCKFSSIQFSINSSFAELHKYMKNPDCPVEPIGDFNTVGCADAISESLKKYVTLVIVTPIIVAVIEVVGVILASALAHELKHGGED